MTEKLKSFRGELFFYRFSVIAVLFFSGTLSLSFAQIPTPPSIGSVTGQSLSFPGGIQLDLTDLGQTPTSSNAPLNSVPGGQAPPVPTSGTTPAIPSTSAPAQQTGLGQTTTPSSAPLNNLPGVQAPTLPTSGTTPAIPSIGGFSQANGVKSQITTTVQKQTQVAPSLTPPSVGSLTGQSLSFPGGIQLDLTELGQTPAPSSAPLNNVLGGGQTQTLPTSGATVVVPSTSLLAQQAQVIPSPTQQTPQPQLSESQINQILGRTTPTTPTPTGASQSNGVQSQIAAPVQQLQSSVPALQKNQVLPSPTLPVPTRGITPVIPSTSGFSQTNGVQSQITAPSLTPPSIGSVTGQGLSFPGGIQLDLTELGQTPSPSSAPLNNAPGGQASTVPTGGATSVIPSTSAPAQQPTQVTSSPIQPPAGGVTGQSLTLPSGVPSDLSKPSAPKQLSNAQINPTLGQNTPTGGVTPTVPSISVPALQQTQVAPSLTPPSIGSFTGQSLNFPGGIQLDLTELGQTTTPSNAPLNNVLGGGQTQTLPKNGATVVIPSTSLLAQQQTQVIPSPTQPPLPQLSESKINEILGRTTPTAPTGGGSSQTNGVQSPAPVQQLQPSVPAQQQAQVAPSPTQPTVGGVTDQKFPGGRSLKVTPPAEVLPPPVAERKLKLKSRKVKLLRVIPQSSGTATANPFNFTALESIIGKASKSTPLTLVGTTFPVQDNGANTLFLAIDPNGNGTNTFRWVVSAGAVSGQAMSVAGLGNDTGNIFNAGQFTLISPTTGTVIQEGNNTVILKRNDGVFFTVTFDFDDDGVGESDIRSSTGTKCGDSQTNCP
ncbi:MAG: hypothetical protein COV66_07530 [Nitrospinae bacterium CG11_big_fil_rev_8_21_14_0_20_45_15]|nr:MAG: hypothetical protein COV66_07530 [Nitrospinae bacterium CG11_big_fil_rev_8_21_14_0_20_45_15]